MPWHARLLAACGGGTCRTCHARFVRAQMQCSTRLLAGQELVCLQSGVVQARTLQSCPVYRCPLPMKKEPCLLHAAQTTAQVGPSSLHAQMPPLVAV